MAIYTLSAVRGFANVVYEDRLARLIVKEGVVIVHVNNGMNILVPIIVARLLKRKCVVHFHGMEKSGLFQKCLFLRETTVSDCDPMGSAIFLADVFHNYQYFLAPMEIPDKWAFFVKGGILVLGLVVLFFLTPIVSLEARMYVWLYTRRNVKG